MSVEQDVFFVAVEGPRKNIVRMMNAALRKFGVDEFIAEDDDINTINRKLEVFYGRDGKDIGISDLMEGAVLQEVLRFIEFVRVEKFTTGLVAKFTFYLYEGGAYDEFDTSKEAKSWSDIARQYGCCIYIDDEYYRNGQFMGFVSATVHDATDGELRSIHLDSGICGEEFPIFLRTLAYLYPKRYVPIWEKYHGEHPDVEYSREECLAWSERQQEMFRQYANANNEQTVV